MAYRAGINYHTGTQVLHHFIAQLDVIGTALAAGK